MKKLIALFAVALALAPMLRPQTSSQSACIARCMASPDQSNSELHRQEIMVLEKEAARAIQLGDATFFHRVYSEDFVGVLTRGQVVNKLSFIDAVQTPDVKYESFIVSDLKVRVFRDTAVVDCLWSTRSIIKGLRVSSQIRVIHVYLNTPGGWRVIAGHATVLPPATAQPF
jgi:uncharacterized protein (TIGR02246 family)